MIPWITTDDPSEMYDKAQHISVRISKSSVKISLPKTDRTEV